MGYSKREKEETPTRIVFRAVSETRTLHERLSSGLVISESVSTNPRKRIRWLTQSDKRPVMAVFGHGAIQAVD
jgi:hypothetical protein